MNTEKKSLIYAFALPFVASLISFVALMIYDGGIMNYYGDFNSQQLTFGELSVNAVHNGLFGWNWDTNFGVNFIGSYNHFLGTPFFWIMLLFPSSFAPFMVGPMLAVKIGCCSLTAYLYIRRFVKKPESAVFGGILYALSGYSVLNVAFYFFHDAMCLFPLLLIGLEEMVINKRKAVFALAVAINAFSNYFFFFGECVFLVIYFIIRICTDKRFRISVADFFCLAFESIVGVLIACALFAPAIFQALDTPRLNEVISGEDFLAHTSMRYPYFLEAIFFPPCFPTNSNLFVGADVSWKSASVSLPLISMAGVIAFMSNAKKHWASRLVLVCLVILLVPGFNSVFTLFNEGFYGRWLYMPVLIMAMMSAAALENEKCDLVRGNKICAIIVGVFSVVYLLYPVKVRGEGEEYTLVPNIISRRIPLAGFVSVVVAVLSVVIVAVMLKKYKGKPRSLLLTNMTSVLVVFCLVFGLYYHSLLRVKGTLQGYVTECITAEVTIEDDEFYRVDTYGDANRAMMLNMPSIESFHSMVPASIYSIYDLMGMEFGGIMVIPDEMYAFKSYGATKYSLHTLMPNQKPEDIDLYVYDPIGESGGYTIYKNDYSLPMGFAYDECVLIETAERNQSLIPEGNVTTNDQLMIAAVILTEEQIEKYSDILTEISPERATNESFSLERFKADATNRIAAGVNNFKIDENGNFSAETSYDSDELVVFSVPFDKGWSCKVNGVETEIDSVNGGFIAVRVPAGDNVLEFTYTTPGLALGITASIIGILLLAGWSVLWYAVLHKGVIKRSGEGVSAHEQYIDMLCSENNE